MIERLTSDLDCGVYENVVRLTYKHYTKTYTIYGFSQDECDKQTDRFISNWFDNIKELVGE